LVGVEGDGDTRLVDGVEGGGDTTLVDGVEDGDDTRLVGPTGLGSDPVEGLFPTVDGPVDGSSEPQPPRLTRQTASATAAIGTSRCTSSWPTSILATSLAQRTN
jgi:hypothetical protein